MKKMVKAILVFLIIVILLAVLAVGALMVLKPDLVRAVYDGLMLDSEQIAEKKKENEKQLVDAINDFGLNISGEDLEKLNSGELSEEDIKDILLGNENQNSTEDVNQTDEPVLSGIPEESPNENDKPHKDPPVANDKDEQEGSEPVQNQPAISVTDDPAERGNDKEETTAPTNSPTSEQVKEYEEKTAELVAKMYALKSQYLGQINSIVASMKAEYAALPKEQRTTSAKTSIANSYLGQISALEAQCDAQVNNVVTELRDVLAKSGKDSSLADSIIAAYNAEKETTKAAYINQYSD